MPRPDWKSRLLEVREDVDKGPMWKRVLRVGAGVVFLVLGILGFFLPVLQGILFTFIGLTLLSRESRRVRALMHRLRGRVEIPGDVPAAAEKVKDEEGGRAGVESDETSDGEPGRRQARP